MNPENIKSLLESVQNGSMDVNEAMDKLKHMPYEDLGFAKLDMHRELRTGVPEVVFCQGKTTKQVVEIMQKLSQRSKCVMGTRASLEVFEAVKSQMPDCVYNEHARIITVGKPEKSEEELAKQDNYILILCAGTADIPVAEEAAVVASVLGSRVERTFDVGVAGLHRLLDQREKLFSANVLVVAAGMEGALPSVVGGMVKRPVIAVPTSIGYGASFNGLAALLAMLNSCAAGVCVVNIDNGFGAGYLAHMINKTNENNIL